MLTFASYSSIRLGLGDMAKISYPDFVSRQYHDLDFITILKFFVLVKSFLQVTANSGPQFFLQTYGRLIFGCIWFLIPQCDFILIYKLLNCKNYM